MHTNENSVEEQQGPFISDTICVLSFLLQKKVLFFRCQQQRVWRHPWTDVFDFQLSIRIIMKNATKGSNTEIRIPEFFFSFHWKKNIFVGSNWNGFEKNDLEKDFKAIFFQERGFFGKI